MTQKFDVCEVDRKRKDGGIKSLGGKMTSLHTKPDLDQIMVDKQEQYSQCNGLLINELE